MPDDEAFQIIPRPLKGQAQTVGIPIRAFLYTLDQISTMLAIPMPALTKRYIYFAGHTIGSHKADTILARNIAPVGEKPEWRVIEAELIRWLKHKRFIIVEATWPLSHSTGKRHPQRR